MIQLNNYLPEYYIGVKEIETLMEVEGTEISELLLKIKSLLDQKFVEDATWGLECWEKELGLAVNPPLTEDERRSEIKARLRGSGKVGAELIKEVVDAYTNGDIEVSFDGNINVQFTSFKGIPSNLDDVINAINEIVPAHLKVVYLYKYLLLKEVHDVMTLAQIQQKTLDKFASV